MARDAVASRAAEESAAHITQRVTEHYERRGRELWGLARRLGASDEQAADVLQEAHLRLWRELAGRTSIQDLDAWTFRVAPNATIGDRVLFDASPGSRFRVVDGPIAHEGFDWYLVERWHGTSQFSEFAWVPATDGERPLIKVVGPDCPTGDVDVVVLLDLIPPERLACFGSHELRLDPTMLGRIEQDPGGVVGGVPDWLAKDPELKLYGRAGATGLDGAIPVHISPTVGDRPPTDTWLTVRGHFDDPAAATCEMTYPEGWGSVREPDLQVLACRERFVITAFETREAP